MCRLKSEMRPIFKFDYGLEELVVLHFDRASNTASTVTIESAPEAPNAGSSNLN